MARKYYTLAVRESAAGFAPQFGDYDRACVEEELEDMKASNLGAYRDDGTKYKASDFRVVTSGDTQDAINAAVAALNAKVK